MKIYALYCIFTADYQKKENLIVSEKNNEIILPIKEIKHSRYIHNEAHYHLQSFFKKTSYNPELLKNINFTHIDIQNELIYKYLDDKKLDHNFDINNDIFLLCCAILETQYELDSCFWSSFKFVKSFADMDCVNAIVDFSIEKSIL